jgi:hypothetical protein
MCLSHLVEWFATRRHKLFDSESGDRRLPRNYALRNRLQAELIRHSSCASAVQQHRPDDYIIIRLDTRPIMLTNSSRLLHPLLSQRGVVLYHQ